MEVNNSVDPALIGQRLLARGFRAFFLYVFRVVNGTPFIVEQFHEDMFAEVANIIALKDTRVCFNVFPRSAKTTFAIYLCIYALLVNPRAQIIYTSFNAQLLRQVSREIQRIMTHPAFLMLFPDINAVQEDRTDDAADPFWADYIQRETGKPTFSASRITTPQGGIIYLASIGSALTGLGAGSRTSDKFAGFLVLDDPDQPSQVRSEVIRTKTHVYFTETLLSRLNSPQTPIINIQQRVHLDDMSAFLYQNYGFTAFIFPLLDANGDCNCPSQYTPARIKELQVDDYVFQAQYQQEPRRLGGQVIKHDWWRYYNDVNDTRYRRIFITADTASKIKEWNDYTAIGVWGVTTQNRLRLLDYVHSRFEMPELIATFKALWDKWKQGVGTCRCSAIYVEDKASGIQAIQELRRIGGLPIMAVTPNADKLTRVLEIVPQIAAGNVELPGNDKHPLSAELLKDTDAFTADNSHKFDDGVDCLAYAVNAAYDARGYF